MKAGLFAALAALAPLALAAPGHRARYHQHERREEGSVWVKRDSVPSTFTIPMRVGLTQSNLDRGHDWLMEVSDPTSSKYGRYYSVEEINDLFAPSSESVDAVRAWLGEAGIDLERVSQSTNKQWLQFEAKVQEAEELLKTKYHIYEHSRTGKTSVGCDEYHVKEDIRHHIDYITPGVKMLELRSMSDARLDRRGASKFGGPIKTAAPTHILAVSRGLEYCHDYISPACIFAMYNISKPTTAHAGNELGIFEETPQFLDQDDMDLYFSHLAPQIPNGTFPTVNQIDGAVNVNTESAGGTEALLDFQISYPIIYPQNSVLFLTDSEQQAESQHSVGMFNTFLDAIDGSYCNYTAFGETGNNNTIDPQYPSPGYEHPAQCGVFKPTNVISFSYELAEYAEGTPENYQQRQCNEYMKLGMQGVSLVFSSGDQGVASLWGCVASGSGSTEFVFNPTFPSNCPYVTSVGATTLTGSARKDQERAVTQFPSGGGFSNYFPRPSYQEKAVEAYFASSSAPTFPSYNGSVVGNGHYNSSGRGFPDVSAVGQAILNWGQGEPYLVSGTSASAPAFAAILTRINEERLSAGKSTIGFVNPVLYQNPQAFHDITVGDNKVADCDGLGFEAAVGWDPLTGLGTPNYPALLEVFMKAGEY